MVLHTDKTKVLLKTYRQKRLPLQNPVLFFKYSDIHMKMATADTIFEVNLDDDLIWNNQFQHVYHIYG